MIQAGKIGHTSSPFFSESFSFFFAFSRVAQPAQLVRRAVIVHRDRAAVRAPFSFSFSPVSLVLRPEWISSSV